MTQVSFRELSVAAGMAVLLCLASGPILAAGEKSKKAPHAKQGSTKFLPGSQETRKERETRLKRECKGRVNAGACEGYTQ